MSVRVFGDSKIAALYDSVTMSVFGPVFTEGVEDAKTTAEQFLFWYDVKTGGLDIRMLTDEALSLAYEEFLEEFYKEEEDSLVN